MKPVFIEFTTDTDKAVSVNINNIVYVKDGNVKNCELFCVGGLVLKINEPFESVLVDIDKAIERSDS